MEQPLVEHPLYVDVELSWRNAYRPEACDSLDSAARGELRIEHAFPIDDDSGDESDDGNTDGWLGWVVDPNQIQSVARISLLASSASC